VPESGLDEELRLPHDACPFSASSGFDQCLAFDRVLADIEDSQGNQLAPRVTCRRLSAGSAGRGRVYPRCDLGDKATRTKYIRDHRC